MQNLRKSIGSGLLVLAIGSAYAQPDKGGDVTVSGKVEAKISASDMTTRAASLDAEMEATQRRLVELQIMSRNQKDIIKLNCVNDKLLQVKQLMNIADSAQAGLSTTNEDERQHNFAIVTTSADKVRDLSQEAEGCLGDDLMYVGRTTVKVERPIIRDDPTRLEPFSLGTFSLERPTYATPYL